MKRFVFSLCLMMTVVMGTYAGDGDEFVNMNGGFLFNSTLNATIGYERELSYSDALDLFGEIGGRWHEIDGETTFKNDYYWGGGVLYKKNLRRFKNASLRFRLGPECGAHTGDWFFAVEGGFELNVSFPNRVQLSLIQKNQVGFIHGDTFRNGLLIGIRVPI